MTGKSTYWRWDPHGRAERRREVARSRESAATLALRFGVTARTITRDRKVLRQKEAA